MDFTKIETAIESWITGMGMQAWHRDRVEPTIRMASSDPDKIVQAMAGYRYLGNRGVGVDEIRYGVNDDDANDLDPEITGHRRLTVSMQVKSIRANAPNHAMALAHRLRTRLRLPTVAALFKTADIALNEATPLVDVSLTDKNGRVTGLVNFDVMLNAAASETDTAINTIGTVEVSSDWKDTGGNSLPATYQMEDEEIVIDP